MRQILLQAAVKLVPIFRCPRIPTVGDKGLVDLLGDLAVGVGQVRPVPLVAVNPLGRVALHTRVDRALLGRLGLVGLPLDR